MAVPLSPGPSPVSSTSASTRSAGPDRFATDAIHAGAGPDPTTGAILTPIHQSTTFVQRRVGEDFGYTYTRAGNPTVRALEERLGVLEGAPRAVCFATGMAAISAFFLSELRAGEHVVVSDVVYGGTVRLLRQILHDFGVEASFVDTSSLQAIEDAIRPNTRVLFLESPANPTLKLTDIAAAAGIARQHGICSVVDNTFLTPVLQEPLALGADVVIHSTTKFLEGHNSTVGGALMSRDEGLLERLRFVQKTLGAPQSPWEAWLTLRGVKTVSVRMARHSDNALRLARWLDAHPEVTRVNYPGLPSFPQYELACRQQRAGGGVLSFELRGGHDAGIALMNHLRLCSLAENLGAVETLVTHPASMTHGDVPPEERRRIGINDGLVRLSVGLEDPADIIADLEQAIAVAGGRA